MTVVGSVLHEVDEELELFCKNHMRSRSSQHESLACALILHAIRAHSNKGPRSCAIRLRCFLARKTLLTTMMRPSMLTSRRSSASCLGIHSLATGRTFCSTAIHSVKAKIPASLLVGDLLRSVERAHQSLDERPLSQVC